MSIPSPQERPDLYDDYDGLADGEKTAVTTPPEIQKLIDEKNKSVPETQDSKTE